MAWALILGILLPGVVRAAESGVQVSEYELKAQFIERFAGFVRWPTETSTEEPAPFLLCLYGESPIETSLEAALSGREIEDRPIRLQPLAPPAAEETPAFDDCELLFLGALSDEEFSLALDQAQGRPILTVADRPGRAEAGVMINLFVADDRIGFEVNESAAVEAGLELSSRLLRLARLVEGSTQ